MKAIRFSRNANHLAGWLIAGLISLTLLLLPGGGGAWAAALTWVGDGAGNDFSTAANWSPAQTPTAADACTINSTNNRQPSLLANAPCGSLTLGTGATVMTLTFTGALGLNITGDVTIGANGRISPSGTPSGVFTIGGNWSDDAGTTKFTNSASLQLMYDDTNVSTSALRFKVNEK